MRTGETSLTIRIPYRVDCPPACRGSAWGRAIQGASRAHPDTESIMTKERKIKANAVTTHEFLHDGNIRFSARGAGSAVLDLSKVSLENRHKAMLEGFVKRIINMAAIERDTDTGASATPADKWARMQAAIEHYNSGSEMWAMKVAAGSGQDDSGLIVQALMRVKSWTIEAADAWIAKVATAKSIDRKAVLGNLRKNPDVLRAIGEIKAERAAANKAVNAADFLAEMEDLDENDEDESVETIGDTPNEEAPF